MLCSVRFAEDITPESLTSFSDWIQGLDENFSLKTGCAYKPTSTIIICRLPLRIWTRLKSTSGSGYISHVFGQGIFFSVGFSTTFLVFGFDKPARYSKPESTKPIGFEARNWQP